MEPTVELVKLVARLFYEDKHAVFLDYLLRERMYTRTLMTLLSDRLPDDVLADRMQILLRDVGKIASRLREDRLIKTHVRPEVREYDGKTFSRTYYYIDFALFADVVRYRLYQMRISLEQKESNDRRYFCGRCKKTYTSLDAFSLVNSTTGVFECELCSSELQIQDSAVTGAAAGNAQARLNEQTIGIQRLFKKLEDGSIPKFDPVEYLRNCEAFELAHSPASSVEGLDGLKLAGSDPVRSPAVSVRLEIAGQDDKTRPSYEMPVWHTHSTITGCQVASDRPPSDATRLATRPLDNVDAASLEYQRFYEASQRALAGQPNPTAKRSRPEEILSVREASVQDPSLQEPAPSSAVEATVMVHGVPRPLEGITEEDKNNMTEEEYQQYYEAYMGQQQ